jgi:hypothetical protein
MVDREVEAAMRGEDVEESRRFDRQPAGEHVSSY